MLAFTPKPDCPVPEVEKIGDDLVPFCDVPVSPPPIIIADPPPPIVFPPIGCVDPKVDFPNDKKIMTYNNQPAFLDFEEHLTKGDDPCTKAFDVDIDLPCFCPILAVTQLSVSTGLEPQVAVVIEKTEPAEGVDGDGNKTCICEFGFKFGFVFPAGIGSLNLEEADVGTGPMLTNVTWEKDGNTLTLTRWWGDCCASGGGGTGEGMFGLLAINGVKGGNNGLDIEIPNGHVIHRIHWTVIGGEYLLNHVTGELMVGAYE